MNAARIQPRNQPPTQRTNQPTKRSSVRGEKTAALPSLGRIGLARGVIEVKQFFREKQAWIFTLVLPVILLVVFGNVFAGRMSDAPVGAGQYFLASMMAFGVMSTSFINLGVGVAVDRDDGTLKRLRGAPVPPTAYFIGKVVLVMVAALVEIVLMLLVGILMFRVELPASLGDWGIFAWVLALGVLSFSLLGIAASGLAGSARNAAAVINLPFLLLMFVSGVFIPFSQLPGGVQTLGSIFPAKWFAQGLRSVFLPDSMLAMEPAGSWQHGLTALILGAWCAGGLLLCLATFRWTRAE